MTKKTIGVEDMKYIFVDLRKGIKITCGPALLMAYSLVNLFTKWGNGDGDNATEIRIAFQIYELIEDLGYEVNHEKWGLHNEVVREIKKNGHTVFKNRIDTNSSVNYPLIRFPADIAALFNGLIEKGLEI